MKLQFQMLTTVVLSAAVAVSVSACVAPKSTPTSAASCSPTTARITWQGLTQVDDLELGYFTTVVDASLLIVTSKTQVSQPTTVSDGTLKRLSGGGQTEGAWQRALLADARHTGEVSNSYGAQVALPKDNPSSAFPGTSPSQGTFITDVGTNQYAHEFSVACQGVAPIIGAISAPNDGGTVSFTQQCGVTRTNEALVAKRAEGHCPSA